MPVEGLRRILLTGDTEGGFWTFVLELADGLLKRGVEVCLATFGQRVSASQKLSAAGVVGLVWVHHASKLEWVQDPWADIKQAGTWLYGTARRWRPSLVHLNTLCHATLDWDVPVVITHHSCVTSWWRSVKGSPLPAEWQRYHQEVERSLKAATVITAPSQSALAAIGGDYGIEVAGARPIRNGRNSDEFRAGEKEELILSAGRLWDEAKNIRALAEVTPRLGWPVYLAGDSQNPDGTATSLARCCLLGKLDPAELSSWYARAAIYVLPARYEPFGLSVLEAGLSKCALVLGDIPSLREMWEGAATFVPPDDTKSLEDCLRGLIADPVYRARMSELALGRAREFTQSRMVDEYVSLYQRAQAQFERLRRRRACAS
jgi:glycosyltransferase involved in cell wall biosynthesis